MSTTPHKVDIAHVVKEVGPFNSRSHEVVEFCQRHAIESYLTKAEELATRLFPRLVRIGIELEEDPEDGDQYLFLEVLANGDEDECFNAHKSYLSIWANSVRLAGGSPDPTNIQLDLIYCDANGCERVLHCRTLNYTEKSPRGASLVPDKLKGHP